MTRRADDASGDGHACCAPARSHGTVRPAGCESAPRDELWRLARTATPDTRVDVPAGRFIMGTDRPTFPHDREGPARRVEVDAFRIDAYAVTNARFAAFVLATGHRTDAERDRASFVFHGRLPRPIRDDPRRAAPVRGLPWWRVVPDACWYAPEGPGTDLAGREDHPVVHVSWRDACAFADWAKGRLPREAEWERAARGGRDGTTFPWGDELEPGGRHRCNVWQGRFPEEDEGLDGYRGTAPVDAFPANGFGLHQPIGNVWEWCDDSFDPSAPPDAIGGHRVQKGGSYLCHASYCDRYRPAARSSNHERAATGHAGFRLAYDARADRATRP